MHRTLGDEGELGRKALHVLRLLGQEGVGDELGEVGVLVPRLLECLVQVALQGLRGREGKQVGRGALEARILPGQRLAADVHAGSMKLALPPDKPWVQRAASTCPSWLGSRPSSQPLLPPQ